MLKELAIGAIEAMSIHKKLTAKPHYRRLDELEHMADRNISAKDLAGSVNLSIVACRETMQLFLPVCYAVANGEWANLNINCHIKRKVIWASHHPEGGLSWANRFCLRKWLLAKDRRREEIRPLWTWDYKPHRWRIDLIQYPTIEHGDWWVRYARIDPSEWQKYYLIAQER